MTSLRDKAVKAYLKLVEGKKPGPEFPLEERQVIGRAAAGWNLVLRAEGKEIPLGVYDALVSRQHASLYFEGGQLMIRDVGSLNGTVVNGRLLPQWVKRTGSAPLPLKDGFIIKIGNTEMEISIDAISSHSELPVEVPDDGLKPEVIRWHSTKDLQELANSFRIILDINDHYCNTDTRVRDINSRLGILKQYLTDEPMVTEVDELQRRIAAELDRDEFLQGPQIWEVRDLCQRFVERWISQLAK
jgi:hypothetical protein